MSDGLPSASHRVPSGMRACLSLPSTMSMESNIHRHARMGTNCPTGRQSSEILEQYAVPARPTAPRYCPVRLLRVWLLILGATEGPLFADCRSLYVPHQVRLNRNTVRHAVKKAATKIGLNPHDIGGNSLRRGCLTWLSKQGVSPFRIQRQSGHKDIRRLLDYIQEPVTPSRSPLMGTRWTEG
jgi:hypothetical protein